MILSRSTDETFVALHQHLVVDLQCQIFSRSVGEGKFFVDLR